MQREPIVLGDRYEVEEELGRGGMAKVFRGTDTVLGRPVAVKILAPQFADDPSFVDRFRREAQSAARLNHPNLVSVYDTGSDDGVHFIVMEYVEGKTLADYLAGGGRIMPQRAIEIAEAVSQALTAAHAQGVIHRDIKPGNIMITPSGDVKVADFGIARVIAGAETIAQTAAVLGTAAYLSPEQAQGHAVDQRSDLYSLGCVLYEMVAGRPPFTGDTPVAVASKQVLEQPVPPSKLNPDVSPQLDAVIMRTLAKNPANRYESAEEFRRDLERARRGEPVEATPLLPESATTQVIARPGARETMVLPPQEPDRNRWWIWLVVLLVLAVLGLVVFLVVKDLLSTNTPGVEQVAVPKVVGLQLADARTALEDKGFTVPDSGITRVPDPTKDPGTVVAQDPPEGTKADKGSPVRLTVVKAPADVAIPPVAGLPADQAQTLLMDAGFNVVPAEEASADVPAGNVTRTDPPEGTSQPAGSDVTMYISSGAGTVAVPDVTCLSFGQAKEKISEAGLVPIQSTETVPLNPTCPHGNKVAAQDPAANQPVNAGSQVTLFPGTEDRRPPPVPPVPPVQPREARMTMWFVPEPFTPEERERLTPYFTNLEGPVFALVNLPEVVKGALFARYSRTQKSLRRLFLDEFAEQLDGAVVPGAEGIKVDKAEQLYERVFFEYGDDSVAQLGGVHLACEQASQLLCKVIEWGRLAAYLEQSTRYMRYDDKPGGRWRLTLPPEIEGSPAADAYLAFANRTFGTYGRMFEPVAELFRAKFPQDPSDSDFIYRSTITAKTCDTLRVLLPAGTRSNLGVFATGQSYEQMLLRMRAHPLAEVRTYADLMLVELRKVIPAFLKRVDLEDRGVAWTRYLAETRDATARIAGKYTEGVEPGPRDPVTLTDYDPLGEEKVIAAAMYASTDLPDDRLQSLAHTMSPAEREAVLTAYVGERANRRHKPGRAFERTGYRFDVLCDYGAFRDLQRHRLLTLEWQSLTPRHGADMPSAVSEAGLASEWDRVMEDSAATWATVAEHAGEDVAQYAVSMAYRIRFVMQMTAREAMHLIELRSSPQGHPTYRAIARAMHRLIDATAGHRAIAASMRYLDDTDVDLERLEAERRAETKRRTAAESGD